MSLRATVCSSLPVFPPKLDFDDFWVYHLVFGYAEHNCVGQRALGILFEALGPFLRFLAGKIKRKEKIIFSKKIITPEVGSEFLKSASDKTLKGAVRLFCFLSLFIETYSTQNTSFK